MQITFCDVCKKTKALGDIFVSDGTQYDSMEGTSVCGERIDICGECSFKGLKQLLSLLAVDEYPEFKKSKEFLKLLIQSKGAVS